SQDVSLQEIGKEISNLPSNSVVLIGVYSLNSWKQYIAPEEVARYFQRINAQNGHEFPFFCLFDVYMSPEVIGGKVNEGRIQGELLGKAAVQLLQTGKISSEITNPDIDKTKWIFSYSALQKYGLEKSINCEESIVLYQPDSFFAKYSKYVILAFSFGGILLLFLLLVSYFNIVLRRQVDKRTKQRDELLWKFEHFIAKMPVGYIETDKNRNIKAWNKTCEKMFGHTFEEVKGRNIIDIVVQEENKKVAKELISSLAKEDVKVSSFDGNISRWGRVMICEWYFTTLYDKEGNIIYHLCLVIDKTEKEQLRKNLEFMLRKNKELLLEHDRFVANSMHDLKNLLTPLIAYSEMMMYNNLSLEKIQTVSEQLNRSANMLVEICTELMNISKIRGELTTVSPVEFDIYEMIRDIIYMTEANYSRKNITVVNEIPENQKLFADPEMVSSVVLNLLSNAAKFTYPNGHIVVSGQMVSDTQFEVMVSDDGMGFKVDNLIEQIGESTYFTTPGTAGEQGTGLGLILVKDLVEKNHGSVRAYNNTTRGATFTFTLPCKKHEEI
ncbi:MAG: PAS domain-containing sensor histidine kinase, partial [Bacteroidales bacterium]